MLLLDSCLSHGLRVITYTISMRSLQVCGKDHLNIDKIVSDFDEKKASNLKYYFYDIANPKDYLTGKDAIAVEKGPYLIK